MDAGKYLNQAVIESIENYGAAETFKALAGNFVGFVESFVEQNGGNPDVEITLSGGSRNVTLQNKKGGV